MPKPDFIRRPIDKILDMKLKDLPNTPTHGTRDSLSKEWNDIQFMLDQGGFTTTREIEQAINRMAEIEAQMDAFNW